MLFVALPSVACATDWNIPSDALENALPKGCDASADAGLAHCSDEAFQKADAELNEVWKKVLATIQPSDQMPADKAQEWKDDLIAAQQAWNTFKQKDCEGARSFEYWGGSGRGLAVVNREYEYTINRTKDLKARYLEQ